MDFVPIYSGYACIRRYIWERNPKAVRLDEKYPPLHMHRRTRTYIRREPALNYANKFREGACRIYNFFAYMQIKSEKSPKKCTKEQCKM